MKAPWDINASMRYLNRYPLPAEFTWPHRDGGERKVQPVHSAVIGYGKWLRETPYFPGLFELCHELIDLAPVEHPTNWLALQLTTLREKNATLAGRANDSLAQQLRRVLPGANQEQFQL